MKWNKKYIDQLVREGKVRSVKIPEQAKKYSSNRPKNIPDKKPKALVWMEWNLQYWANQYGLSMEKEHRFATDRKWRFDFAFPGIMVAVEFEGGIFMESSGHNTPKHYTKDTEKYSKAAILGWKVLRYTAMNYKNVLQDLKQICDGPNNK
jgi:hypothetical protein